VIEGTSVFGVLYHIPFHLRDSRPIVDDGYLHLLGGLFDCHRNVWVVAVVMNNRVRDELLQRVGKLIAYLQSNWVLTIDPYRCLRMGRLQA